MKKNLDILSICVLPFSMTLSSDSIDISSSFGAISEYDITKFKLSLFRFLINVIILWEVGSNLSLPIFQDPWYWCSVPSVSRNIRFVDRVIKCCKLFSMSNWWIWFCDVMAGKREFLMFLQTLSYKKWFWNQELKITGIQSNPSMYLIYEYDQMVKISLLKYSVLKVGIFDFHSFRCAFLISFVWTKNSFLVF